MPKKHDSKMCAECNGFGYTVGAIIHRPGAFETFNEKDRVEVILSLLADKK